MSKHIGLHLLMMIHFILFVNLIEVLEKGEILTLDCSDPRMKLEIDF